MIASYSFKTFILQALGNIEQATMKKLTCLLLFIFSCCISHAQAGMQIYVGASQAYNALEEFTPLNQSHPGYHVGVDGRLNEGNMYFLFGAQFHNVSHESRTEFELMNHMHDLRWLKCRGGLGYHLFRLTKRFKVRGKTLASLDLIYPELAIATFGPYRYNDATFSGVLGLGIELFGITADIEYHHGFINAIHEVEESTINFWAVNAGFFF